MRIFNTSGPNDPKKHYTLLREKIIKRGLQLVKDDRYFTIWAPRQTGKSTYFLLLKDRLEKLGYKVAIFSTEDFKNASLKIFLDDLSTTLAKSLDIKLKLTEIAEFSLKIRQQKKGKCVLIIDEIEGINPEYFGDFLHSLRKIYHFKNEHCLKSVILVGVANITGVVQDNASPFNIADNIEIPYFTREEVWELYGQHEQETGQKFAPEVKDKVFEITAGQPGLVNGFAWKMINDYPNEPILKLEHYYNAEYWYLRKAIDKNVANILNKANQYRSFIEGLLFTEEKEEFRIDNPAIKFLYVNGLITDDEQGYVKFWVPLYKKRIYDAFYPYTNGERKNIISDLIPTDFLDKNGNLNFDYLINSYREYVKRRGFKVFLEKDQNGNYIGIKEKALIYSFETYINAIVSLLKGKIYREADTGLGKSDLIVNINGKEILVETKVFYDIVKFEDGKKQLAYYCKSLGLNEGYYIVFIGNDKKKVRKLLKDSKETFDGVSVATYIVEYDVNKW